MCVSSTVYGTPTAPGIGAIALHDWSITGHENTSVGDESASRSTPANNKCESIAVTGREGLLLCISYVYLIYIIINALRNAIDFKYRSDKIRIFRGKLDLVKHPADTNMYTLYVK